MACAIQPWVLLGYGVCSQELKQWVNLCQICGVCFPMHWNVCKRIGEDPRDWGGTNITLKGGKRRRQVHAVTRQPNFNTQKNSGIKKEQLSNTDIITERIKRS